MEVTNRTFQQKQLKRWRWLHYDIVSDSIGDKVFCYLYITALKTGKMKPDGSIEKCLQYEAILTGKMYLVTKKDLLVTSAAQFTKEQLTQLVSIYVAGLEKSQTQQQGGLFTITRQLYPLITVQVGIITKSSSV